MYLTHNNKKVKCQEASCENQCPEPVKHVTTARDVIHTGCPYFCSRVQMRQAPGHSGAGGEGGQESRDLHVGVSEGKGGPGGVM